MAGPSVISRNESDGGYFVVLRNERAVNAAVGCVTQGDGSP